MRIAIIGASAAGIFSALVLGRAGHDISLIEQDKFAIAEDAEAAARTAFRAGAPQIVQPHVLLPKCRELLLEHLPDVYRDLLAAGALEAPIRSQMPPSLTDKDARPGDERLTLLMTRRSTLDWTLRRAIANEGRIQRLCGMRATGLIADGRQVHHINGVRTDQGDVSADLVIDASGYRTRIDHWLADVGAVSRKYSARNAVSPISAATLACAMRPPLPDLPPRACFWPLTNSQSASGVAIAVRCRSQSVRLLWIIASR